MKTNKIIKKTIDTEEKNFKLIIIMNICIILFLLLLIRLVNGPINLKTNHHNLAYEISIGSNKIDRFSVQEEYKKMIVPFFAYYHDKSYKKYNLNTNTFFVENNQYNLNLNIYSCSKDNQEVSCITDNPTNLKKNKLSYNNNQYKLYIKYQEEDNYIYKGKYQKNITKYLSKPGYYYINIVGKYKNTTSDINFIINII